MLFNRVRALKVRVGGLEKQEAKETVQTLVRYNIPVQVRREVNEKEKIFGKPTPEYKVITTDEGALRLLERNGLIMKRCGGKPGK